jgi:hypothetical protein
MLFSTQRTALVRAPVATRGNRRYGMKKRLMLPLSLAAAFCLSAVFAGSALAVPSFGTCGMGGCHTMNSGVVVGVSQTANDGTTATYSISVSNPLGGATGWAVYQGSTKITDSTMGSTSSFSVADGQTYTVYGGDVSSNFSTRYYNTASISPRALDTTPPTTTSDARATYLNSATIHLSASDNAGGSGVAHTYYILDAGSQTEGTTASTSVLGTHTIEFWSVDASGNVELPHNVADFTVATAPSTFTVRVRINLRGANYRKLSAVLGGTAGTHRAKVDRRGNITFANVLPGTYRLTITGKKFKFKARTIVIGSSNVSVRFR